MIIYDTFPPAEDSSEGDEDGAGGDVGNTASYDTVVSPPKKHTSVYMYDDLPLRVNQLQPAIGDSKETAYTKPALPPKPPKPLPPQERDYVNMRADAPPKVPPRTKV